MNPNNLSFNPLAENIISLLQNNPLLLTSNNSQKSQYKELVTALLSAFSNGEPTSVKIGNQTLSINIINETNLLTQSASNTQPSNLSNRCTINPLATQGTYNNKQLSIQKQDAFTQFSDQEDTSQKMNQIYTKQIKEVNH